MKRTFGIFLTIVATMTAPGCGDDSSTTAGACGEGCVDDGLFCNGTESCDEDTDVCVHSGNPCTGGDLCIEEDDQCCVPNVAVTEPACNAEGDVTVFDSCGDELLIDDCGDDHGTCHDAQCGCEDGYGGDDCGCVIFVDGEIVTPGDGSAWDVAFKSVQDGVDAATANQGGCAVWVKGKTGTGLTYAEKVILADDVYLYGGFAGDVSDFTSRDASTYTTILDGEDNGTVVTYLGNEDELNHAVVDGFTVTGGSYGGLRIDSASPTVSNCIFHTNTSPYGGGAFLNGGSPLFVHCTFRQNATWEGVDGVDGGDAGHSGHGGGMYISSGTPTLIGCTFVDNFTGSGGNGSAALCGMMFYDTGAGGNGGHGGGVYVNIGTPAFINCIFAGNTAGSGGFGGLGCGSIMGATDGGDGGNGGDGGGVYVDMGAPTLSGCTLEGNSAGAGGAGGAGGESSAPSGDGAPGDNGANGDGGGIFNGGVFSTLTNCILWENFSLASGDQIGGALPFVTFSDIQGGHVGDGNIDAAPLFVDATVGNLRLQPGSPCVDTGSNAALPLDHTDLDHDRDTDEPLPFDMDGNARVVGTAVDMGAYEAP